MADKKISQMTELAAPVAGDYLPIVDVSEPLDEDKNKRVPFSSFVASAALGANVAAFLATPSSANLATAMTDESGTAGTLPFQSTGSWTPTLQDSSLSDSEGQTYTTQQGAYIRIGSLCIANFNLVVNSLGTLTTGDQALIGGLPFAASGGNHPVLIVYGTSLAITAGHDVSGYVDDATTIVRLVKWSASTGATSLTVSQFSAGGQVLGAAIYRV